MLVSGKYFNKGVNDDPDLGHVVREKPDKIIVFGKQNRRDDIPISEIQHVGANVLTGLELSNIKSKYSMNHDDPLPTSRKDPWDQSDNQVDLATYERKYPHSLFNKGVRTENEDHVGHFMKETSDKIVVFGHGNGRRFGYHLLRSQSFSPSVDLHDSYVKAALVYDGGDIHVFYLREVN